MVVDDSQTVRNIMGLILNRTGYRSVRVASAMEALQTLTEVIPDLIFLDITLPGMDGLDVCKIIKENERTKDVPVVMLSGNNEDTDFQMIQRVMHLEELLKETKQCLMKLVRHTSILHMVCIIV